MTAITYRQIARVALPIIAANALLPLQGLIDTAIMGRLDSANYLSALGLASSIFAILYTSLNFLQYATSGLSAQALGSEDYARVKRTLWRALIIAAAFGVVLILARSPISELARWYFKSGQTTETFMIEYIGIRLYAAPAELAIFALIGWFAGQSLGKFLLIQQCVLTASNVLLSVVFVYGFGMTIDGVAWGTVIANYLALASGLYLVHRRCLELGLTWWSIDWGEVINRSELFRLTRLNGDLFIRTLMLVACFSWFQRLASELGENYVAANVILLWLLTFAAYILDGIAVAAEGLTGQAIGSDNNSRLKKVILKTASAGIIIALLISIGYGLTIKLYIESMTTIDGVRDIAMQFRWWAVFLPIFGVGGYLLDGYYFGATASKPLRNAMLIVATITLPVSYGLTQLWGNIGIWIGVYLFLLLRIVLLAPNLSTTLQQSNHLPNVVSS